MLLTEFTFENRTWVLKSPAVVDIEETSEGVWMEISHLNVTGYGPTRHDALWGLNEDFAFQWESIVESREPLSDDALALKDLLLKECV